MSAKGKWASDVIVPAAGLSRTIGHMRPRKLDDLPASVRPGSREAALVTIFAREQEFALKPVMEALEVLSKLEDWSQSFLVADELTGLFNWRNAPFKKYASFADFYARELEETWGTWKELQTSWAEVVAGRRTEAEMRADMARRAKEIDAKDVANQRPIGINQYSEGMDNNKNVVNTLPTGNSAARALRKLRKDRPDIHACVLAGELSPHAGMIEAGFRKKRPSVKRMKRCPQCGHEW